MYNAHSICSVYIIYNYIFIELKTIYKILIFTQLHIKNDNTEERNFDFSLLRNRPFLNIITHYDKDKAIK